MDYAIITIGILAFIGLIMAVLVFNHNKPKGFILFFTVAACVFINVNYLIEQAIMIDGCQKLLPRDQHCKIMAVPVND